MGIMGFTSEQLDILKGELESLRKENERLLALAYRDPLTGLRNRRCFSERLAEELCRHQRRHAPVSVICLDVNGFKHLNDTKGHLAGDSALVGVGQFLETLTRAEDLCCRMGGDEFAVLLPDTDAAQCRVVVQRIRARLGDLSEHGRRSVALTRRLATAPARLSRRGTPLSGGDCSISRGPRATTEQLVSEEGKSGVGRGDGPPHSAFRHSEAPPLPQERQHPRPPTFRHRHHARLARQARVSLDEEPRAVDPRLQLLASHHHGDAP